MTRNSFLRTILSLLIGAFAFGSTLPVQAASGDAAGAKRIVVSLMRQTLYAYQGTKVVFSMAVNASGTATGNFRVQNKIRTAAFVGRGWLPYWLGVYFVGHGVQNGIHGPWSRNGRISTSSLGCVVIRSSANAARLYSWAYPGIPVSIHW
jgi:L,D-transpeptidase catalytic domain